jgi:hypothetical protein
MLSRVFLGIHQPGVYGAPPQSAVVFAMYGGRGRNFPIATLSVWPKGNGGLSTAAPQPRRVGDRLQGLPLGSLGHYVPKSLSFRLPVRQVASQLGRGLEVVTQAAL